MSKFPKVAPMVVLRRDSTVLVDALHEGIVINDFYAALKGTNDGDLYLEKWSPRSICCR